MARRKTRKIRRVARAKARKGFLDAHEEDKVMLFATGMVFATAVTGGVAGLMWYTLHALAAVITMLALLEWRHRTR